MMCTATTTRSLSNGTLSLETPYSDTEAHELLAEIAGGQVKAARDGDREFAKSLCRQWDGRGLTAKQMFYVHKVILDTEHRARELRKKQSPAGTGTQRTVDLGGFRKIAEMFAFASQQLKWPKIIFALPSGTEVRLTIAGPNAKVPGSVTVATGRYGDPNGRWYGRINRDGQFEPSQHSTPEVEEALKAFAADPAAYAGEYGRVTGNCCFCARTLTDERSVEVGYGPICSAKWGLPWGDSE